MDFTATWAWPQWTTVAMLFIRFAIITTQHGKQKLQSTGDEKGQPERYNGFAAMSSTALWAAVLICGGFFA